MPTSHGINDVTSLTSALLDYPFPSLPYFSDDHLIYDPLGKIHGSGLRGPVSLEGASSSVTSTTDKALHLAEQWSSAGKSAVPVKTRRLTGATGSRVVFTVIVSGLTRRGFNLCVAPSYRNQGVL